MKNKLQLTSAQQTVQNIDHQLARLDRNSTPVINALTELLASAEDPQGVFDIWGNDALETLLEVKAVATALTNLGCEITPLRADFAMPEVVDGKPTGRLIFKAQKKEELESPPIGNE